MRSVFFSFCCILLGISGVSSQEYSYTHYDTKDGLAGSTVYAVVQSADGFIWFGTETGLSRFDGRRFKTFTMADGLPSNEILSVFTDSKGRIWLVPFGHSISYYYRGKIHNQENDSVLKKVAIKSLLHCIAEDDKGTIILQTVNETIAIRANNEVTSTPLGLLHARTSFNEQYTMLSSRSELHLSIVALPPKVGALVNQTRISSIPCNRQACLFSLQIRRYSPINHPPPGITRQIPLPPRANIVSVGQDEIAYYNSKGGIVLLNKDDQTFRQRYFTDYTIQDVTRDRENNLWFTTKGSGVFKINNNRFKNLFAVNDKGTTYIRDIQKIGPYIYVGGHNDKYWKFDAVQDSFFQC